jgi:hypothetical protein
MESKTDFHCLPIRLKPHLGESLHAYLVRVAGAYCYASPRLFCNTVKRRYGNDSVTVLAALGLTPADIQQLQGPAPPYCPLTAQLPGGLSADDFCRDAMRWCPDCLRSGEYIRASWCIKFSCVCPIHKTLLLDRCAACGSIQRMERASLARCRCGSYLARAQSVLADDELLPVQEAFAAAVAACDGSAYPRLTASEWVRLFHFMAVIEPLDGSARTGRPAGLQRVPIAMAYTRQLSRLLQDWPNGFHDLLAKRQQNAKRSFSIQKTFGRLYRWLYVELGAPAFQFLRDGFEEYLNDNWRGPICARNRRMRDTARKHYGSTTIRELANKVGTSPGLVKRLCQAGQVESTMVVLPSGRRAWSIPDAEAKNVSNRVRDGINLSDAAVHLRLPRRRIRELLAAGSIHSVISAGNGLAAAWLLSRDELEVLARKCAVHAAWVRSPQPESVVTLRMVLKAWRLNSGEFLSLLDAMQSGDVRCFMDEPYRAQLGDLLLDRESVRRWREVGQRQGDECVSIDIAARILGVKQEVAYQLVKRNALASSPAKAGSPVRRVSKSDIQNFSCKYISLVELARLRKQSPRAALESLHVVPAMGPYVDGCRQYFFLRSDFSSRGAF